MYLFMLLLVSLAAAAPAASPAVPPAPVRINRCHLNYTGGGLMISSVPGALHIAFTDIAPKPVSEIAFAVLLDGRREVVNDRGTFSTGAQIEHVYDAFRGSRTRTFKTPQPTCTVESVQFADGSTWHAPTSPPTATPHT
jgi:hypothetical protein